MSDTLQRATESVPKEEVSDKNPHLKNLYEGLTMTEAALQSVFKRHGVVPLNPIDEKFNPNLHEALFQQVSFILYLTEIDQFQFNITIKHIFFISRKFKEKNQEQ